MAFSDMSRTEQMIVQAFLDEVEKQDKITPLQIQIFSGGDEPDYVGSFHPTMIKDHIAVSDETTIRVCKGQYSAGVVFVHGNDADIISDIFSRDEASVLIERLLGRAYAVAEQISDGTLLVDDDFEDAVDYVYRIAQLDLDVPSTAALETLRRVIGEARVICVGNGVEDPSWV